ncbi:DUF4928 domain-containing protein [Corallincola luteus]|uniref:DNA (cytosine-5-)-methyltransferase n=1 Tax=Corallincola luteus TaxID=1775177 RepID=A0ABY2AQN2_9GAMM|nr:DUF4928 family protein [Corallincola luteus]TCI04088.1 DUF4928 domain-containing protein [Corallincola luteus]
MKKDFLDFFAGIGLVEIGLQNGGWEHTASFDRSLLKFRQHQNHFGNDSNYVVADVFDVNGAHLPSVFLAHASFPCTDVSSAGSREGSQEGKESSAIDSFLRILFEMGENKPAMIMLENVKGLITSNNGKDLRFLVQRLNDIGYLVDIFLIDAKHFVPQSRERVFLIGHSTDYGVVTQTTGIEKEVPHPARPKQLIDFIAKNSDLEWFLGDLPLLPINNGVFSEMLNLDEKWWDKERTEYLFSQMFERHKEWINSRVNAENYEYATAFRRMRARDGKKQSTAELRTDGIAGCLRTAKGGSAKQIVVRAGQGQFDARLLSPLECARLMGAGSFNFASKTSVSDALFCLGDAVCTKVIEWIDENYLTPFYSIYRTREKKVALPQEKKKKVLTEPMQSTAYQMEHLINEWNDAHIKKVSGLPEKGRTYSALVVLYNLEDGYWSFEQLKDAKTTDKGVFFSDRSVRLHTAHRVKLALAQKGKSYLASDGEQGRTSTATKRAGLEFMRLAYEVYSIVSKDQSVGDNATEYTLGLLYRYVIGVLEKHHQLGGIDVTFDSSKTLSAFVSKLLEAKVTSPGAVAQHLVGAKLELRYKDREDVKIKHHGVTTADIQTGRLGDFEVGQTVFHVTKTPTADHRKKALENANSGRKVYLLVPSGVVDSQTAQAKHEGLCSDFSKKVEVFSLEQFIAQNIDEIAVFERVEAITKLRQLLEVYNLLIEQNENDMSLRIQIPDMA